MNLFIPCADLIRQIQPPFGSAIGSEIIRRQAKRHARDMRRLDALAAGFLNAADGDPAAAEELLDTTVGLLLESGILSTWRYRILLAAIRESGAAAI
jgi:hypothetical protein